MHDHAKKRRRKNADAPVCRGTTARGDACTHKCLKVGSEFKDFCGMHDPEKPRKPKDARQKRAIEHSHPPNADFDPTCELCVLHGNILTSGDADAVYALYLSMAQETM